MGPSYIGSLVLTMYFCIFECRINVIILRPLITILLESFLAGLICQNGLFYR